MYSDREINRRYKVRFGPEFDLDRIVGDTVCFRPDKCRPLEELDCDKGVHNTHPVCIECKCRIIKSTWSERIRRNREVAVASVPWEISKLSDPRRQWGRRNTGD